ncbi:unnamed protein product, partial [Urochloa humidicola]
HASPGSRLPAAGAGVGPAGSAAGGHTSPGSRSGGRIRGGRTYLPRIGGGFSLRAGLRKKMGVEVSREADAIPGFDDLFLAAPSHPAASHRPSTSRRAVPLVVIRRSASFAQTPPPCGLCAAGPPLPGVILLVQDMRTGCGHDQGELQGG